MDIPRVLVLLATYQGAPWITEQMGCLLGQCAVEVEVLASDDGSNDGTDGLLAALSRQDARLTLLPASGSTGSAAANFQKLITSCHPEGFTHVAFCDQDDVWQPTKLSVACRMLAEGHCELYSSAVSAWWQGRRTTTLVQSPHQRFADYLFEGAGQGCTFVMTRALFDDTRAFILKHPREVAALHYHDWLIYALARSFGQSWLYDPTPRMLYRQHPDNDTGAQLSSEGIARRLQKINSGWYRAQIAATVVVCRLANPEPGSASLTESLMTDSKRSLLHRLRWSVFTLTRSRRRLRDRLIVCAAALLGRV